MNYEGVLTVRATSTGRDGTLAGIAALVAEAQVCGCVKAPPPDSSLLPSHICARQLQHLWRACSMLDAQLTEVATTTSELVLLGCSTIPAHSTIGCRGERRRCSGWRTA